ncbi:hypothetical protein J2T02_002023 [Chitinophaga terrae (ex Kim and Jung 2007)]|uniref:hypothetical protein n=1 Tax=Chitinophaga terrae (ex Kim and Jung 2007) TaxID=408074 RepID=UPI0027881B98|nr:hypothetical protein [Chitinophaga terrae (ex Kim and Jung 2007)]MDQ0106910.1 hypothetical protein [Chitinophaga terrae (ex Kim and Jung 2007)]
MKNLMFLFLISLLIPDAFSQKHLGRVCFAGEDNIAGQYPCMQHAPTEDDSIAEATIQTLLKPIGLHAQFYMRECEQVQNFAALISDSDQVRYILYNKVILSSIADPVRRDWDKIAIYLHELAHHLNGNTSNPNDNTALEQELHADEFSGMQMAKLNTTLTQAQRYLNLVPNPPCENDVYYSHPCLEKRLNAVAKGWYYGKGLEDFYKKTSSRHFTGNATDQQSDPENHLKGDDFFEYTHCVRSDAPCTCVVTLKACTMTIDFQKQTCSLMLNLTDQGHDKCGHPAIDTTITASGRFQKDPELLPKEKLWIDFHLYSYLQSLRFTGEISSTGVITGSLITPNERGASWALPVGYKPFQDVARMMLRAQ